MLFRSYDEAGNVTETHEHKGEPLSVAMGVNNPDCAPFTIHRCNVAFQKETVYGNQHSIVSKKIDAFLPLGQANKCAAIPPKCIADIISTR